MSYLRLDDVLDSHPKVQELTEVQAWRWVRVMLYCARHETDGEVSRRVVERLGLRPARLVELGLLDTVANSVDNSGNTFYVHDYLEFNPSKEEKERERERWRDYKRGSRSRANVQGGHKGGVRVESGGSPGPSAQGRSPSPKSSTTPTSTTDSRARGPGEEGLATGQELATARLLSALGALDDTKADYIRGAAAKLPESVTAGLLELVRAGHARDPVGYVIGALRRELGARGTPA